MALKAEANRQAEEQRRRAEADDLKQRALREMMNGTLVVKKVPTALENMVRKTHSCMEIPVKRTCTVLHPTSPLSIIHIPEMSIFSIQLLV